MNIFRKKEKCCCGSITQESIQKVEQIKQEPGMKILGTGCVKCKDLEKNARKAVEQLQIDMKIEHISDIAQIASYGIMSTPALFINGKVVSYGKVLSIDEIKAFLK